MNASQETTPKITIYRTPTDRLLEIISAIGVIAGWVAAIYVYRLLPDRIPMHYSIDGTIDGWSGRGGLWAFPILASFLYGILSLVNRIPSAFNMPVEITQQNAARQYHLAMGLLRWLKCFIVLFFDYAIFQTWYNSTHPRTFASGWDLALFLLCIFSSLGIYFWRARANRT
jgi:hypothetical protein